jgi:4-oxalocrotonate tautomerase
LTHIAIQEQLNGKVVDWLERSATSSIRPSQESKVKTMPHVIVKLWPGKSEKQKALIAEKIAQDVMDVLGCGEESVSVAMKESNSQNWAEKVYKPDIVNKPKQVDKKPGYGLSDLPGQ